MKFHRLSSFTNICMFANLYKALPRSAHDCESVFYRRTAARLQQPSYNLCCSCVFCKSHQNPSLAKSKSRNFNFLFRCNDIQIQKPNISVRKRILVLKLIRVLLRLESISGIRPTDIILHMHDFLVKGVATCLLHDLEWP